MKKILLSLMMLGGSVALISSCNKIVDEIKKNINAFNYKGAEVEYVLPATIPEGEEYKSENQTYELNINQIIDENISELNVGIEDFSKITINKITLRLENTDESNNWTNFEYATVKANTDKGISAGKADLSSTATIEDKETERFSDKVITFADHNLKDYVNGEGTKVSYSIIAKARRDINKELKVIADIEYSFKP